MVLKNGVEIATEALILGWAPQSMRPENLISVVVSRAPRAT
jgi:hypothetical protein